MIKSKLQTSCAAIGARAGVLVLLAVFATVGCERTSPTSPQLESNRQDGGGFLRGITASVSYATTAPPPPPPTPPGPLPTPEFPPSGRLTFRGILTDFDQDCPDCTLTVASRRVFVPHNAELVDGRSLPWIPTTLDEVNRSLRSGQPFRVISKADPNGGDPIATKVQIERSIRTTGTVNKTAFQIRKTRVFTLTTSTFPEVEMEFTLTAEATVRDFSPIERVQVLGVATRDGKFMAGLVEKDGFLPF